MNEISGTLVLIVDDEKQIHRFLCPALEAVGYRTLSAFSGSEGLRLAASHTPDAMILDLGLPDIDGKLVLDKLRVFSRLPVVVLSARDREAEKIASLDAGADDYVEKPFGLGELLARLRVVLRRRELTTDARQDEILVCGPIQLDPGRHEVRVDSQKVTLSPREYQLLAMMMRHEDKVLTHRQLLTTLWGPAHADDVPYLRVYIGQLRQKLGTVVAQMIATEPNVGYRLTGPPV